MVAVKYVLVLLALGTCVSVNAGKQAVKQLQHCLRLKARDRLLNLKARMATFWCAHILPGL